MKLFFRFLLLFVTASSAFAQDYTPVHKGLTYQFVTANKDTLITMSADNAYVEGTDSIFELDKKHFKNTFYNSTNDKDLLTNLFGKKIIKTQGKVFLFVTASKDTLVLKPNSSLNSTWIFSKARNLQATLVSKTYESFLGVQDSIATIQLNNGKIIKLSKHYGFYSTNTPIEYLTDPNHFNFSSYTLDAIKEINLGSYFPQRIYNYEVGDTWGQSETVCDFGFYLPICPLTKRIFYEVTDKQLDPTKNIYHYTIKKTSRLASSNEIKIEVITEVELANEYNFSNSISPDDLELLTYEIVFPQGEENEPLNLMLTITNDSLRINSINDFEASAKKTYSVGIGVWSAHTEYTGNGYDANNLITNCYNTTHGSYGDCDSFLKTITAIDKEQASATIGITPNPASDRITIQNASKSSYEILNNQGVGLLKGSIESNEEIINVSGLVTGLYILRINDGTNTINKKIVIE